MTTPKYIVVQLTSGTLIPVLLSFLGEAVELMVPWFIAMFTTVMADLAAGLWKSYRLKIPIRFSKACRETMGKMIVYFAFVLMAATVSVAAKGGAEWTKWLCLFIIAIEFGSMISNLLKPYGINLSMNAFVKAILTHSALPFSCENIDDLLEKEDLDKIREDELAKEKAEQAWKEKKSSKGSKSTSKSKS